MAECIKQIGLSTLPAAVPERLALLAARTAKSIHP